MTKLYPYVLLLMATLCAQSSFSQVFERINLRTGPSSPSAGIAMGNNFIFSADDGINGRELWITDGTESGTRMVKNIRPTGASNPQQFVNVNGTVFFVADNGTNGVELWKT